MNKKWKVEATDHLGRKQYAWGFESKQNKVLEDNSPRIIGYNL